MPADAYRPEATRMVLLGELLMILDLHRQGLSVTAIARRTGRDPKTIRKYIERGLEPPAYGPRQAGRPSKLAPYLAYLRERVTAFPDLSAVRLTRELRERGYTGAYTAVKRFIAAIRPPEVKPYEVRFETPPGQQAQVDFARSSSPSPPRRAQLASSGCSRSCSAIPGTSRRASSCIRTCRPCCAATSGPWPPFVACRSRSSTTA